MFTRGYPYYDSSTFSKFGHSIMPVTSRRELDIIQPTPHRIPKAYTHTYIYIYIYLVGGIPTPLKNMSSSVGMMKFPIYNNIWENKKCSKPPIGYIYIYINNIINNNNKDNNNSNKNYIHYTHHFC